VSPLRIGCRKRRLRIAFCSLLVLTAVLLALHG
jgi:hypothetical protein